MTYKFENNELFYNADDIAKILNVSKATAYREIKKLNEELSKKGYITMSGRISSKYFLERLYC